MFVFGFDVFRAEQVVRKDRHDREYAQAIAHFEQRMTPEAFEELLASVTEAHRKAHKIGEGRKRAIVKAARRDRDAAGHERWFQRKVDRLDQELARLATDDARVPQLRSQRNHYVQQAAAYAAPAVI